jgi:acyl-coenzyme A thioesterase PaaI-like protein
MQKQPSSRICFLCSIENPMGLKLFFYTDEQGRCVARHRSLEKHQGYPGILHGGIISALLDVPTQIPVHSFAFAV